MTGSILVIDANRKLVCDSEGNPAGVDFSERSYVNDGLHADTIVVGNYTLSKLTGAAVLPVALPLKRAGQTVGVVATGIKLDWLQARIVERGLLGGGAVTLADREGVILAREPYPDRFVGTKIPSAFLSLITADEPGTIEARSQDGTERVTGYRPISRRMPVYVSAGISKTEAFQAINRTTWTSVLMLALSVLIAFVASAYIGGRFILKPIFKIVQVLEDYKAGKLESRTRMAGHHSELGLVGGTVDRLLDELEVRRCAAADAEERRTLIASELSHRVKNTLAVVTAIARQTFAKDEKLESFQKRLSALGRAYDLLFAGEQGNHGTAIAEVVNATLRPYEDGLVGRFEMEGPPCPVQPEAALALSLVIHELATNATKYGSLSNETGKVRIFWECQDGRVSFHWHETGGPPVAKPERTGFGSQLIRRAFSPSYQPELTIDYATEGLRFRIVLDDKMSAGQSSM